jgi:hypothetical protein
MITAELVGGPRDGETCVMHAAMSRIHITTATPSLTPPGQQAQPPSPWYHLYRLRKFGQLMHSSGWAFYDYDGMHR